MSNKKSRLQELVSTRERERVPLEGVFRFFDHAFRKLDRPFSAIPRSLDPMAQTGAVANVTFLIALVTGLLLLLWYVPSAHKAYDSVAAMAENRWLAGMVRSVHRYSSDAAIFFIVVHWARMFAERRFGGARWVAWVTGLVSVAMGWLVGWTGYWLAWNQAGQEVATASAELLDILPVFHVQLSRTFLTDEAVIADSLLFFMVFLIHMLLPLFAVVAIWLHISRVRRAKFLTNRPLSLMITGVLIVISIIFPAPVDERAQMLITPASYTMDVWYLWPLMLTDRISTGAVWAAALIVGVVLYSIPWVLVRGRASVAVVDGRKCDECQLCTIDCPYGAVAMVPRNDPKSNRPTVAAVDPSLCVGCGICTGSCDSSAISIEWMTSPVARLTTDAWLAEEEEQEEEGTVVTYVCGPSRARNLEWDDDTGKNPHIPGARFIEVPCAGWVHALTVERALRKGAAAVLIVGCPDGANHFREGGATAEARMSGEREPALRLQKVDGTQVWVLREHYADERRIAEVVSALRRRERPAPRRLPPVAAALLGIVAALGIVVGLSLVPYKVPNSGDAEIVVTLRHPGELSEGCRDRTPEELEALPMHMRTPTVCERARASVRMWLLIDGEEVLSRELQAPGVHRDGIVTEVIHFTPPLGEHELEMRISDTVEGLPVYVDSQRLLLEPNERVVIDFDNGGFKWATTD